VSVVNGEWCNPHPDVITVLGPCPRWSLDGLVSYGEAVDI